MATRKRAPRDADPRRALSRVDRLLSQAQDEIARYITNMETRGTPEHALGDEVFGGVESLRRRIYDFLNYPSKRHAYVQQGVQNRGVRTRHDGAPLIRVSFTRITPGEEDEYPDEEHGWINEDGVEIEPDEDDLENGMSESESIVHQAVKFLKHEYARNASSSHFHTGVWYSTEYETIDYRTGTDEERSFHLDGFSPEEEAEIFKEMTR